MLRTERRQLLRRGRVACSFDELTIDTPRNRFVRDALLELTKVVRKPELARECRVLAVTMERGGVSGEALSKIQRHWPPQSVPGRIGSEDRRMLAAARLAFDLKLPTEDPGLAHIATPDRQEHWVRQLFERAVGGFYWVALSRHGWRVLRGRWIHWPVESHTPGIESILPAMKTDIELERRLPGAPPIRIVIDTKFTPIVSSGYFREQSLSSQYIYQIYAYVRSQECPSDPSTVNSTAVLLHPAIDSDFDKTAIIQGHEFRFVTVNLAADTQTIRGQLLRVVSSKESE